MSSQISSQDQALSGNNEQPNSWSLWRLDDNGNRYMIGTFPDKTEAEKTMQEFESRGHKQMYWIEANKDKE